MSLSYDSSDEEFDIQEEDLTMILAMHVNKKLKHGGSVFGRQKCGGKGSMPTTN